MKYKDKLFKFMYSTTPDEVKASVPEQDTEFLEGILKIMSSNVKSGKWPNSPAGIQGRAAQEELEKRKKKAGARFA